VPTWSRSNPMQRRMLRANFWLNQYPGLVTYILIGLNAAVYALVYILSLANHIPYQDMLGYGAQINEAVLAGQW